jgi:uncharacterized membrane protein
MFSLPLSVAPLLASPLAIQVHVFAALAAFIIGCVQMLGRKGVTTHRVLGWSWVILMLIVAASSFWIVDFRNLKPTALILALSALVLVQVPLGVRAARAHQVEAHRKTMQGLFLGALLIAGVFTLLPGRLMHQVLFG